MKSYTVDQPVTAVLLREGPDGNRRLLCRWLFPSDEQVIIPMWTVPAMEGDMIVNVNWRDTHRVTVHEGRITEERLCDAGRAVLIEWHNPNP